MTTYYFMSEINGELLTFPTEGESRPTSEEAIALTRFFTTADCPVMEPFSLNVEGTFDPGMSPKDFASLALPGVLAASPKAWEVMRPHVEHQCQAVPLEHSEGRKYVALRVHGIVDALDYRLAKVIYRKGYSVAPEHVHHIQAFAFKDDVLQSINLFRLPETRGDYPIVSEQLKEVIEQAGLTGARFRPLPMAE